MLLATQFDYQRLRNPRIVYGLLAITVLMRWWCLLLFPSVNGAHRWITLKGFSIQPSEAAKLALAIFLAYFLEKRAGEEGSFWRTSCRVACIGSACGANPEDTDLGTALMLGSFASSCATRPAFVCSIWE